MKILVDTHILLWWFDSSPQLSDKAKAIIMEVNNSVWVSVASIWEIVIKQSLGKLKLPKKFQVNMEEEGFQSLPILAEHANQIASLPLHHRDPFDRMLIAQAAYDDFTILTKDKIFSEYKVKVILA